MTDLYHDTGTRYRSDPAFYSAVRTLEAIAREHGFTPGELKQIAFKAALNIEETRALNAIPISVKITYDRDPIDPEPEAT